ncbi:MAG: NAD(P)-dependent oxidoreductase, partial [Actinobacteria bacterium]|nr:NAD(P)-dependent oxidoreductase [Actinomycetota bacterium]
STMNPEELTNFYFQEYGVHACSFRLGDVYGPLDTHINLIPVMIRRALAGKSLEIPYGGDHVDSHTYNKDIAEAIYSAFTAKTLKRSIYNITGGRNWKMTETAKAVMNVIPGSEIKLGPGMIPNGFFGISYVRPPISVKTAQEELGYKVTPLEQGIKETAEWMKKNWDFIPRGYFDLLPDSWWVK